MMALADPTAVLDQVPMWATILFGLVVLAAWLPPIRNPVSGTSELVGGGLFLALLTTTLTGNAGLVTAGIVALALTEAVLLALSGPDVLRPLRRRRRLRAAARPTEGPGRHRAS